VNVLAEIVESRQVSGRDSERQKIQFSVLHPSLNIQSLFRCVVAVVMQNGRNEVQKLRCCSLEIIQLIYGGNSVILVETSLEDLTPTDLKLRMLPEILRDSLCRGGTFAIPVLNTPNYSFQYSSKTGVFYILNQDETVQSQCRLWYYRFALRSFST
jgi:hypothetical protein